ncbi:MAG: pilus assembly protein [Verrucomicrobia bacterium]|nr:pilus assembly protein [Verrucomicrobiota bacterium]
MKPRTPAHTPHRRAQALTEMAIVLPLLVLLFLAAVDYSRVFFYFQQVESAAAAGAQIGCMSTSNAANTTLISSNALLQTRDMANLSPSVASTLTGSNLAVTVSANFRPLIAWPFLPTNVFLRRTVNMRVMQ